MRACSSTNAKAAARCCGLCRKIAAFSVRMATRRARRSKRRGRQEVTPNAAVRPECRRSPRLDPPDRPDQPRAVLGREPLAARLAVGGHLVADCDPMAPVSRRVLNQRDELSPTLDPRRQLRPCRHRRPRAAPGPPSDSRHAPAELGVDRHQFARTDRLGISAAAHDGRADDRQRQTGGRGDDGGTAAEQADGSLTDGSGRAAEPFALGPGSPRASRARVGVKGLVGDQSAGIDGFDQSLAQVKS